jgi:hypothetical protein
VRGLADIKARKQKIITYKNNARHTIRLYIKIHFSDRRREERNLSLDIFHSKERDNFTQRRTKIKESYFVLKGCIRTYYVIDGEEKTTAFYTEMEGLTPPCVISKTPSEYYISCIEDNILIISNSDMEVEVNSKFPKFETLCRILSEELLAKQRIDFDEFKTSSPEQRYLNLITKKTRPYSTCATTPISKLFRH